MGSQRVVNPLAESRDSVSGRCRAEPCKRSGASQEGIQKQSGGLFLKRGRLPTKDSLIEENIIKPNGTIVDTYIKVSTFII